MLECVRLSMGASRHHRAVLTGFVLACLFVLGSGTPARASHIVYLDANHNVWVTSPDGAIKRQLTTNGSTRRYMSPTETDAGIIVVSATQAFFYDLKLDGASAGGPWTALDMDCASQQNAFSNQVNPAGTMNVYYYLSFGCGEHIDSWVAFANYNALTGKGVYPKTLGSDPRWVPGTHYAAAVSDLGSQIFTMDTASGTPWITGEYFTFRYFDISRSGNKVLIAKASSPGDVHSPSNLVLWQNNGTPPASGSPVCALANWGDNGTWPDFSMPRWSPDGTQFTWSDSRGVFVSAAPVAGAGGLCVIHPKLIAAGGNSPDWGLADLAPGRQRIAAALGKVLTPASKAAKIGAVLKRGYSVSFTAPGAGRLVISWYRIPKGAHLARKLQPVLIASGTAKFAAVTTQKLVIRLTANGKRLLRSARSVKLTAKATFTKGFTLKR